MTPWYCVPSANPARCEQTFKKWKAKGYMTAVLLDAATSPNRDPVPSADIVFFAKSYQGYFHSINALCRAIGRRTDLIVTGGDDMYPDPNHTASEIGDQFYDHFSHGFGVMQPIGDDFPGTDKICGSPWFGRDWYERAYNGAGPFWPEYRQFYGDEELLHVAQKLGVLWQRKDLVQHHAHWQRVGAAPKTDYQERNDEYVLGDKAIFERRRDANFPYHEPMRDVR